MTLADRKCIPCRGGVPTLTESEIEPLLEELSHWQVVEGKRLYRSFKFNDFAKPMELANKVAVIAEEEGHHPDLHVRWGELEVEIWTHKVNGLTESDFILAAKIDKLC